MDNKTINNKEIPDVPLGIIKAASRGRLITFIGAGVPRIIGCPSWQEFAHLQLKYLYEKGAISYYEYKNLKGLDSRKLLSICKKLFEEKKIGQADMKSLLKGDEKKIEKYGDIFKDLYAFNAIYVTTNFDDYMDKVAQKIHSEPLADSGKKSESQVEDKLKTENRIFYKKEELLPSNLDNGNIIHLHGSIKDENSMIVTIADYMKNYEKESEPAVLLEKIFQDHTVLFVGYGLEEYEILEFMVSKVQKVKGVTNHYMLYPVFEEEVNLLEFHKKYYADLGIQLIPYPISKGGYEHLFKVIKEWAKNIGPKSRPKDFYEKIKEIDEVI